MQRLGGTLLMMAGTALGAYVVLPPPQDGAERLAEVTRISAAPNRDARAPAVVANVTLPAAQGANRGAKISAPADTAATGAMTVAATVPAEAQSPSTWSTVVSAENGDVSKLKSSKPGDTETRTELTRDLQRELNRVGCYAGDVNGNWTADTQKAMSTFMDRVNATLPVSEPDYILLTLVQGHKDAACGSDCPKGQIAENGRCVPTSVVAKATRKQQRDEERRIAEAQKAEQQQRIAEELKAAEQKRVAEAKLADEKRADEARRIADQERVAALARAQSEEKRLAEATAAKKTAEVQQRVAQSSTEVLPWQNEQKQQSAAATKVDPVLRELLPGRMSVGAPTPAESSQAVAAVTPEKLPAAVIPEASKNGEAANAPLDLKPEAIEEDPNAPPAAGKAAREGARQGLPGTKSGATVRKSAPSTAGLPGTKSGQTVRRAKAYSKPVAKAYAESPPSKPKFRPAKIAKRPAPVIVYSPPKPKYYASAIGFGKKQRRDAPMPGTARFNLMMSLGGVY